MPGKRTSSSSFSSAAAAAPATTTQEHSISPNLTNFVKGSLLSITLEKFMIHDKLHLEFGSSCNIIMGPNGSGKSSIVCGLILGLGGDHTTVLKRGNKLEHFIKNTAKEARIKIKLLNTEGNEVEIERRLVKEWNSARNGPFHEWKIDGQPVPKRGVDTVVDSIGVKLDNLCQVLPQEKVGDFTKLTPQQLLKETEKTLGNGELYRTHEALIDRQRRRQTIEKNLERKKEQLDHSGGILARLHAQREAHRDTETTINEIKLMKEFLPALRVKEYALKKSRLQERDKEESDKLKECENNLKEANREKKMVNKRVKVLREELKAKEQELEEVDESIDSRHDIIRKGNQKVDELTSDIANCQKRLEERDDKIIQLRRNIEVYKQKQEECPSADELKAEHRSIQKEKMKAATIQEDMASEEQQEKEKLDQCQTELKQLEASRQHIIDSRRRLEQTLRNRSFRSPVIDSAVRGRKFLRDNQWNGPVYGPLSMHVTPKTQLARIGLENALTLIQKMTFVCSDPLDFRKLTDKNLGSPGERGKKRLTVYKCHGVAGPERLTHDKFEKLKKAGFTDTLDNLIDCPEIIRTFLVQRCKIDKVLVGGKGSSFDSQVAELVPPGYRVLTEDELVEKRAGCVSGAAMTTHRPLQSEHNSCFHTGPDQQRLKRIDDQIAAKLEELEQQEKEYHTVYDKFKSADDEVKKIQKRLDKNNRADRERRKYIEEAQRAERELAAVEGESVEEIMSKKGELVQNLCELNEQLAEDQAEMMSLLKERKEAVKDILTYKICIGDVMSITDALNQWIHDLKDFQRNQTDRMNQVRTQLKETSKHLKKALVKRDGDEENASPPSEDWMKKREEVCKKHNVMPEEEDAANQLDHVITYLQAAIDAKDTRTDIVQRYEKKQEEVAQLKQSVARDETQIEDLQAEIRDLVGDWHIESMTKDIGQIFKKYMRRIGFHGDVVLQTSDLFENYGLAIKVAFKDDTELQTLNVRIQSGGERAVATMVFMLALQSETRCPFRLIDEINQGMDAKNERHLLKVVFQGCADTAVRRQYIMITPKILTKMDYPEHVLVHTVYNGPEIQSSSRMSFHQQIEKLRKRQRLQ